MAIKEQLKALNHQLGFLIGQVAIAEQVNDVDVQSIAVRSLDTIACTVRHEFLTLANVLALHDKNKKNDDDLKVNVESYMDLSSNELFDLCNHSYEKLGECQDKVAKLRNELFAAESSLRFAEKFYEAVDFEQMERNRSAEGVWNSEY
ncbi:MAG: hypothetical protein ACMV0I_06835 [Pseudomonas sp.]